MIRRTKKERGRVLQALWNFVSILIILIMCYHWPASVSPVPRPFVEEWPTINGVYRKELTRELKDATE